MSSTSHQHPASAPVYVVDLDAGHAQFLARQVRAAGIYSEILPRTRTGELADRAAAGVILAGDQSLASVEPLPGVPVLRAPRETWREEDLAAFLGGLDVPRTWTPEAIIDAQVAAIRERVGTDRVICGLSGGVDSSVAAALVQRAIGDQLHCVFVDHGLLREGEVEQVRRDFVAATGVNLTVVDATDQFLAALAGVSDPEAKRKAIGREFIRSFEAAARALVAEAAGAPVRFLVQGTLYPDVIESGADGATNIKSHHNVGGLPDDLQFELIEPLRELFKDEVREVGEALGVPESIVWRQPFPGPGLGIRIVGEVTAERLAILRRADAIVREELSAAGLDRQIWQCPVVLLADVHSVGVLGEERTYGHPVVLRPVESEDAMSAQWSRLPHELLAQISQRITAEVREINRVVLDVTNKPPGTIEWE